MKFTKTGLIKEGLDSKSFDVIQAIADKYSYGEILDALESFYTKNDENKSALMARVHAKEFRRVINMPNPFEKNNVKEGSCGYSENGNINVNNTSSNTPGGLKSMPADKKTLIIKKLMEKIKSNKS